MNEMSYEYDGKIFPVQEIIELVNKKIDFLHYFIFLLEVQIGYYIRSPVQKIKLTLFIIEFTYFHKLKTIAATN